eukprot:scaffold33170_cov56-Isochrysis_galbana.AAC.1
MRGLFLSVGSAPSLRCKGPSLVAGAGAACALAKKAQDSRACIASSSPPTPTPKGWYGPPR